MREVLRFDRLTPAPGPDADAVGHEYAARTGLGAGDLADAVLRVGGIATVYDVLVNDRVVLSGRSMFESHEVDVAGDLVAGENVVRVLVHPLTDLLDAAPRRPRARWRTMLTDEARLRWARTSVLGRAPGFAPGPPVVGPFRPLVLETRRPEVALRTSVEGALGVLDVTGEVEVEVSLRGSVVAGGRGRLELPEVERWWPHSHGEPTVYDVAWPGARRRGVATGRVPHRREPLDHRRARPVGQRRADLLPRRGLDAG